MITFTNLEYELPVDTKHIFSRLDWAVEEIEESWIDWTNLSTGIDTNKAWAGKINRRNLNFTLEEPDGLFRRKFNIIVKGRIISKGSKLMIKIRLGLDNPSGFFIVLIYLAAALFISTAIIENDLGSIVPLSFWLLAFPGIATYLIRRRLRKAELKLDLLFA